MNTIEVKTWAEFKRHLEELHTDAKQLREGETYRSELLFRGQERGEWELSTTLERWGEPKMPLQTYMKIARGVCAELQFRFRDHLGWESISAKYDPWIHGLPNLEFLAYLRHHGFPSPLLDWSSSPLIAAAFAFHRKPPRQVKHTAIFAYQEFVGRGKSWSDDQGCILTAYNPYPLFPRHTNQQSKYSYCVYRSSLTADYVFFPHEKIFQMTRDPSHPVQDQLTKFLLPVECRKDALEELLQNGLTPFFLFQSDDALVHTMALKHLEGFDSKVCYNHQK